MSSSSTADCQCILLYLQSVMETRFEDFKCGEILFIGGHNQNPQLLHSKI